MENPNQKMGKVFLLFAGICIVALPFIVIGAMSSGPDEPETEVIGAQSNDFDEGGESIFINYDQLARDYIEGTSTERTLDEFYARRQYPGSPPFIPHKVKEADLAPVECLTCHSRGGWSAELRRHTPVTPHPQFTACRQCHVPMTDALPFVEHDWVSVAPPRLGRAALPGGPPPVPHELQMRGNCIACHVGPGTVATIRVEHPSRGNCRQCHVPQKNVAPFKRDAVVN